MPAPIPANELARLQALRRYHILDTAAEDVFDDITRLASFICETPIAVMSLVDSERQWFKSKVGLSTTETHRDHAFCAYTILEHGLFIVEDALEDRRFANNPLVTGEPQIRFYAATPLMSPDGFALGALCVIDRKPRTLNDAQKSALKALGRLVVTNMELRRVSSQLAEAVSNIKTLEGLLPICSYCKGIRNDKGYWERVDHYLEKHTGAEFTHGVCPECYKKVIATLKGARAEEVLEPLPRHIAD